LHAFEAPFESRLQYAGVEAETIAHYRTVARQEALTQMQALAVSAGLRDGAVSIERAPR